MVITITEKYGQSQEAREFAQAIEKLAVKFNLKIEINVDVNGQKVYANFPEAQRVV